MKISKPKSPIEKVKNSHALQEFTFCVIEGTYYGMAHCLHPGGSFLGKSRMKFVAKLRMLFNHLKDFELKEVGVGISLDVNPGAETVFFHYFEADGKHNKTIAFNAEYKDGMIYKLYSVKTFVPISKEGGIETLDIVKYN